MPLIADAREGLAELSAALGDWRAPHEWAERARGASAQLAAHGGVIHRRSTRGPTLRRAGDRRGAGAAHRIGHPGRCAAGGLPGELHKHWQAEQPGGYHLEYGYSCMGYEIAGALGVKLARPEREVIAMVGDGSYLMLNSEIATSVRMGLKLIIVLLDNGGFGCIERLQSATGNASFNNMRQSAGARRTGSTWWRTRVAWERSPTG